MITLHSYMYLTTIYNIYTNEYYHYNLDPNTYYYYRIRYLDNSGYWSDYSDSFGIYSGDNYGSNTVNNLYAEMYGSSSFISWDEHYDAQQYEIEFAYSEYGSYMHLTTLYGGYITEYYHDNLEPETSYYYKIRYLSYDGYWSEFSDAVMVYSGDLMGEGVMGFSGYNQNGEVHLSWDDHYQADFYEIWSSDTYSGDYNYIGYTYSTSYVDYEAPINADRFYKVRLVDSYGYEGAYSAIISIFVNYNALSDNNNLTSIFFSDGTLDNAFDQNDTYYLLTVGSDVEELTVTPYVEDENATVYVNDVEIISGTSSVSESIVMANNDNAFVIDVYAENGVAKTYYIDVFREPTAELEDFVVHGAVNVHYDEFNDLYYIGTELGVTSVDLEVYALDPTAIIRIDGYVTDNRTISLSGDYVERAFNVEIDPNDGLGISRFIDVIIIPNWTNDNPGGESVLYYTFPVTLFDEYMIQWDDKVNGSGLYDEDILVTALYSDMSTVYSALNRVNSGFHSPVTITAQEEGVIVLKVEAVDGGVLEDNFALRVYNETNDYWEAFLVSGDTTIVIE